MFASTRALFNSHTGDAVVPPSGAAAAQLRPEHFVVDPSQLRYPSNLDFSHSSFKLRDVSLLESVPKGAPQRISIGGNELVSLELINRFQQLRTLVACANALQVGGGLVLRLPKLVDLDLSSNRLVAIPPLGELPQLQVLRLQRNQIARNWGELSSAAASLRELDVSQNRLSWQQRSGEFDAAMGVLR
jgi:Leucine-rich repeat (LRR) protein